jgi:hypothetical protein
MTTENIEMDLINDNDDETISIKTDLSLDNSNRDIGLSDILSIGTGRRLNTVSLRKGTDCYKTNIMRVIKKVRKTARDGKSYVKVKELPIYFYETSSNPGARIRDAITGHYHNNYHVGKMEHENLFYKTAYCVGDAVKPGQKYGENREPIFLYFYSPESYENHFQSKINETKKKEWHRRYEETKKKIKERKKEKQTTEIKYTYVK